MNKNLDELRNRLEEIDDRIMSSIKDRFSLISCIAELKKTQNISMMQPDRVQHVQKRAEEFAGKNELSSGLLKRIFDLLVTESCRLEGEIMGTDNVVEAISVLETSAIRIDHIVISVSDLDEAIETYTRKFGFVLLDQSTTIATDKVESAEIHAGGVKILLQKVATINSVALGKMSENATCIQCVAIEVAGQDNLVQDLANRGAESVNTNCSTDESGQSYSCYSSFGGMRIKFVTNVEQTDSV